MGGLGGERLSLRNRSPPRSLGRSAGLMYFHLRVSASAMMSPGRGQRDWLATCHCGEDAGSGRGHDVISLSGSYTPAMMRMMMPKVVRLALGGGVVSSPAVGQGDGARPVEEREIVLVFSSSPELFPAQTYLARDVSIGSSTLDVY